MSSEIHVVDHSDISFVLRRNSRSKECRRWRGTIKRARAAQVGMQMAMELGPTTEQTESLIMVRKASASCR